MIKKPSPPPVSFLFKHPAHIVATGFGSGLSPFAPGTAGTLFAWGTYWPLRALMDANMVFSVFLLVAFALGVWCCQITGRSLGVVDHGAIVWDEIVPFWTVLLLISASLTPMGWAWQLAAFLWFRIYDIVKPQPAKYFDTQVKNGFGVMMDDAVAAGYTVLTILLAQIVLAQVWK